MKAEFVFLFLALLFGILFVFLTPPFQVPDEPAHFYRAWQTSEGDFVPHGGGAEMPVVTAELAAGYWRLSEHAEERVLISEPRLQKSSGRCEAQICLNSLDPSRIDPDRQFGFVMQDPVRFLRLSVFDYIEHAPRYLSQLIGRLGWLDTPLPLWLLVVYALALVLFASIDGMAIPVPWRLAVAIAVAANLVLISLSQYLTWTPVDADFIHGLQGRYLIPIAPFALLLLSNQTLTGRAISRFAAPLAITISAVALATTALVLVQRYFVD